MALAFADFLDTQVAAHREVDDGRRDVAVAHLLVAHQRELGGPDVVGRREVDRRALAVEQTDADARGAGRREGDVGGRTHRLAVAADRVAERDHTADDHGHQHARTADGDGVASERTVERPTFLEIAGRRR